MDALANTRITVAPHHREGSVQLGPQGRSYERTFSGTGADEDIVVSSARAYVTALNKVISFLRMQEAKTKKDTEKEKETEEKEKEKEKEKEGATRSS